MEKDENGVEVKAGDWIKSSSNDYIPTVIEYDEDIGGLIINTYHATLKLEHSRPFTKCEPCTSERCCNDFGRTRCTYNQ